MKQKLLIAIALCAPMAWGAQLTPEEALARMEQAGATPAAKLKSASGLQLAYTATCDDLNAFYVYNRPSGGFMLVSADDSAPALLGWTDNGSFDYATLPANMRNFLAGYSAEIAHASKAGLSAAAVQAEYSTIEPLLTTTWNQRSPYNANCPVLNGENAPTGCVATAMAQVMNYHRWPETGTGSNAYTFTYGNQTFSLSMDFSQVTFDWDNMNVASYQNQTTTAEQDAAVAKLMEACGIAVEMEYAPEGSGAAVTSLIEALYTYFSYSPGMTIAYRYDYTAAEWNDMIYAELAAQRPVPYCGGNYIEGGHEFVCDGYSAGYFHFNWGWNGYADGYFLLTTLNPFASVGVADYVDYAVDSSAVLGVCQSVGATPVTNWASNGSFLCQTASGTYSLVGTFARDDYMAFVGGDLSENDEEDPFGFFCYTLGGTASAQFGLKLTDENANVTYVAAEEEAEGYDFGEYTPGFSVSGAKIPNGVYMASPAVNDGTEWHDIHTPKNTATYAILTVADSGITMSEPDEHADVTITLLDSSETPLINLSEVSTIMIKAENAGTEYFGGVMALILDWDGSETSEPTLIATGCQRPLYVAANSSADAAYVSGFVLKKTSIDDQKLYYLVMCDPLCGDLSEPIPVYVDLNDMVEVGDFAVSTNAEGTVDPENAVVSGSLTATSKTLASQQMSVAFIEPNGETVYVNETMGTMPTLTPDAATTFYHRMQTLASASLPVGTRCLVLLYGDDLTFNYADELIVTIGEAGSGVAEISADGSGGPTTVYTVDGKLVGDTTDGLAPGLYLVRQGAKTRKVAVGRQ